MTTLAEALADAGYLPPQPEHLLTTIGPTRPVSTEETAHDDLPARVAALEAECAALAAELDADRHEYDPDPADPGWCRCRYRADARWHRTAAWVRRSRGLGAP